MAFRVKNQIGKKTSWNPFVSTLILLWEIRRNSIKHSELWDAFKTHKIRECMVCIYVGMVGMVGMVDCNIHEYNTPMDPKSYSKVKLT